MNKAKVAGAYTVLLGLYKPVARLPGSYTCHVPIDIKQMSMSVIYCDERCRKRLAGIVRDQ